MKKISFKKWVSANTAIVFMLQQISPAFAMEPEEKHVRSKRANFKIAGSNTRSNQERPPTKKIKSKNLPQPLQDLNQKLTSDPVQYQKLFKAVADDTYQEIKNHLESIESQENSNLSHPSLGSVSVGMILDRELDEKLQGEKKKEVEKKRVVDSITREEKNFDKKESSLLLSPVVFPKNELEEGKIFDNVVDVVCTNIPKKNERTSNLIAENNFHVDEKIDIEDEETRDKKEQEIRKYLSAHKNKNIQPEHEKIFETISQNLIAEMKLIKETFSPWKGPLVMLIGETGSGKTTLVNWLTDKTMIAEKDPDNGRKFILHSLPTKIGDTTPEESGGIVHGVVSGTTRPGLWPDPQRNVTYADCPGFGDTRGILKKIKNALYMRELFRDRENVKFLIAESADSFEDLSRGTHFVSVLNSLKSMFKDGYPFTNGLFLVVTQHNHLIHKDMKEIQQQMTKLSNIEEYDGVKDLLISFASGKNKIAFFSRPTASGSFQNDEERGNIIDCIQSTQPLSFSFKQDILISLPDDANLLINIIYDGLKKYMSHLLKENVEKEINTYIKRTILENKKEVDSLVDKAMEYYTPFVLAFYGTQSEDKEDFNQDTENKAVVNRNWSTIWAGGTGVAAGGAAFALITAVTGGIALIVGGVAGGAVALGSYFIQKANWVEEITLRIKEVKRKEIRLVFKNLSKKLRMMKFDIHVDSLMRNGGLLEGFNPDIDLSNICETVKSLDCIDRIKGKNKPQSFRNIWKSSLSDVEKKLRLYALQSAQALYTGAASISMIDTPITNSFDWLNQENREKESNPFRIGLSIDGGGIRGLIPALYLDEIERLSKKPICKLFDVVGGTSVGGLLGLGIVVPGEQGRPLYQAKDFVDLFQQQGKTIFSEKSSVVQNFFYNKSSYSWQARYKPDPLERILAEKFTTNPLREALKPIVIAAVQTDQQVGQSSIYIFDSKQAAINPKQNFYVKDVARATAAAPTYFPAATISSIPVEGIISQSFSLLDGGILTNNPSEHVYTKMLDLYPNQMHSILSLGTGVGPKAHLPKDGGNLELAKPLIAALMNENEQGIDDRMKKNLGEQYMRMEIDLGKEIPLDNASDEILEFLQEKAEEKFEDIENITRFLLMNYDALEDLKGFW